MLRFLIFFISWIALGPYSGSFGDEGAKAIRIDEMTEDQFERFLKNFRRDVANERVRVGVAIRGGHDYVDFEFRADFPIDAFRIEVFEGRYCIAGTPLSKESIAERFRSYLDTIKFLNERPIIVVDFDESTSKELFSDALKIVLGEGIQTVFLFRRENECNAWNNR